MITIFLHLGSNPTIISLDSITFDINMEIPKNKQNLNLSKPEL